MSLGLAVTGNPQHHYTNSAGISLETRFAPSGKHLIGMHWELLAVGSLSVTHKIKEECVPLRPAAQKASWEDPERIIASHVMQLLWGTESQSPRSVGDRLIGRTAINQTSPAQQKKWLTVKKQTTAWEKIFPSYSYGRRLVGWSPLVLGTLWPLSVAVREADYVLHHCNRASYSSLAFPPGEEGCRGCGDPTLQRTMSESLHRFLYEGLYHRDRKLVTPLGRF